MDRKLNLAHEAEKQKSNEKTETKNQICAEEPVPVKSPLRQSRGQEREPVVGRIKQIGFKPAVEE